MKSEQAFNDAVSGATNVIQQLRAELDAAKAKACKRNEMGDDLTQNDKAMP